MTMRPNSVPEGMFAQAGFLAVLVVAALLISDGRIEPAVITGFLNLAVACLTWRTAVESRGPRAS